MIKYDNVNVVIHKSRWEITTVISDPTTGKLIETYVASADSYFTENSGIYFDVSDQYEKDLHV